VIPGKANRKRAIPLDKARYRSRNLIENAFCRLMDFRRIAAPAHWSSQGALRGSACAGR